MKNAFPTNLRELRKEKGLTQEQLAEVFDVSIGAVHKWEAGLSTPDIGLIMEIADFFDTSLDTITGFNIRDNRVKEMAARLRMMIDTKDLSGLKEAEMALKKYPHSIDIVYECAVMYMAFAMLFKDSRKYYERAQVLFEQALRLLPMNTNPKLNDTLIYSGLAYVLVGLEQMDKAIALLEENNAGGIFNADLGNLLATSGRFDQANIYLSYGIIGHLGKMISFTIGKALYFLNEGKLEEAKACMEMGLQTNSFFRKKDMTCSLDKTDCMYLTGLALVEMRLGNKDEAVKILKKAKKKAEKFDAAPDYDARNLRFYDIEPECILYDSTGDKTAVATIDYVVDFLKDKELTKLWKTIRK